jgi:hypothetical protein
MQAYSKFNNGEVLSAFNNHNKQKTLEKAPRQHILGLLSSFTR